MCDGNAIKSILPIIILDGVIPTADVYSDWSLMTRWYSIGHWKYATCMLIPLLLNIFANFYVWWRWDNSKEKRWTWILVVAGVWPQYRAIKLSISLYKGHQNAEEEKRRFAREISPLEAFFESIPAVLVMTTALFTAWSQSRYRKNQFSHDNLNVIIGGSAEWFFATYFISIVTASLGITKYLLNGPFRVLPDEGFLNGLFTWRFFLAYLAVMCSFLGKMLPIVFIPALAYDKCMLTNNYTVTITQLQLQLHTIVSDCSFTIPVLMSLGLNLLPQLLMSVMCIACSTGLQKNLFKIIVRYPEVCLLPMITVFTIGPRKQRCGTQTQEYRQLILSKSCTALNVVISLVFSVAAMTVVFDGNIYSLVSLGIYYIPCILLTAVFFTLDTKCCCCFCVSSQDYCCFCCGKCCCAKKLQYHYLDVNPDRNNFEFETFSVQNER